MKLHVVGVMAAALAWAVPVVSQSKPAALHTRHVFVTVLDRAGKSVLDLGPSDFEIAEQGVKRSVQRAGLATNPMRIAMLIDTSDGAAEAVNQIRAGLVEFLEALPPQHEVMLVSTGRQTRIRVPPTTDRKKLTDAAT